MNKFEYWIKFLLSGNRFGVLLVLATERERETGRSCWQSELTRGVVVASGTRMRQAGHCCCSANSDNWACEVNENIQSLECR